MASIVLSFVGNQDPYSSTTKEEGSIVTLIRYLQKNNNAIKKVVMLYTEDTQEGAELTKECLTTELTTELNIASESIEIIPVSSQLSQDPVNLLLATKEARQGLEKYASPYREKDDYLEFNASSGTPVMKSAWSILQASGYAPNSRVWQIRNPHKLQPEQELVFETNVTVLKNEFDIKVIKKQINNYNYSGALATLEESDLNTNLIKALIEYGYYRLAFNFEQAYNKIEKVKDKVDEKTWQEIYPLKKRQSEFLLREVYYKLDIKVKQKEYSDFLILLSSFQENVLRFLVKYLLLPTNLINKSFKDQSNEKKIEDILRDKIEEFDEGLLKKHLKAYKLENKRRLNIDGDFNRLFLKAIIDYFCDCSEISELLENLEDYCKQRNDYVHDLRGVKEIDNVTEIMKTVREILEEMPPYPQVNRLPKQNTFDLLNQKICSLLDNNLRG